VGNPKGSIFNYPLGSGGLDFYPWSHLLSFLPILLSAKQGGNEYKFLSL